METTVEGILNAERGLTSTQPSFLDRMIAEAQQRGGEEGNLIVRSLKKHGAALQPFASEVVKPIGAGVESLAVQLKSGDVLKLTSEKLEEGFGTRAFDAPVLRRGTVQVPGQAEPINYLVQPKVEMARTPTESQRFFGELSKAGYGVWDPGERQFGYHQGQAVLVDYSAATAPHGGAEFPGRAPVRSLPEPVHFGITESGVERRVGGDAPGEATLRRPISETPEQLANYKNLPQSLSQSRIQGDAPLRAPAEIRPTPAVGAQAAAKMAAGETLNELHVNLETKSGQFLKKLMRLPFKKHSRIDMARVLTSARRAFGHSGARMGRKMNTKGLVGEGELSLTMPTVQGGELDVASMSNRIDADQAGLFRSGIEQSAENVITQRRQLRAPRSRVTLEVVDDSLDMQSLDQSFTHYYRHGLAYSS